MNSAKGLLRKAIVQRINAQKPDISIYSQGVTPLDAPYPLVELGPFITVSHTQAKNLPGEIIESQFHIFDDDTRWNTVEQIENDILGALTTNDDPKEERNFLTVEGFCITDQKNNGSSTIPEGILHLVLTIEFTLIKN